MMLLDPTFFFSALYLLPGKIYLLVLSKFLFQGTEMYGLGNWAEVAEHVGTKSKEQCIEHYTNVYKNSPLFPFPV